MGKFVVKKTKTGFKFNLKAGNGEIIATSEVYNTKGACLNGVKSVINNAPKANFEDQTLRNERRAHDAAVIHNFFNEMRAPARHARDSEQRSVEFLRNIQHTVDDARKQVEIGAHTLGALAPF